MGRLSLVLLCAVLVLAPAAVAAERTVDRGIVVRVMPRRLVIRELDGSRMRFVVTRAARVTLDGRRVRLMRLQRGDVASVRHDGMFVVAVRAFRP